MKTIAALCITAALLLTGGPANASTDHHRWYRHHTTTLTSKAGTTTVLTQVEGRVLGFQGRCITEHRTRKVTKFVIEGAVVTTTAGPWSAWFTFSGPHPCLA